MPGLYSILFDVLRRNNVIFQLIGPYTRTGQLFFADQAGGQIMDSNRIFSQMTAFDNSILDFGRRDRTVSQLRRGYRLLCKLGIINNTVRQINRLDASAQYFIRCHCLILQQIRSHDPIA
ncbi:hypothetical protein D3C77_462070 [compost metagenome]